MANSFGIPPEVETRLRQQFKVCAYCSQPMQDHAGVKGCPSDKATIEHLNRDGPFYWADGLQEEDLVICCCSCNASRGRKLLFDWFASAYCKRRGVTVETVADTVKWYLAKQASIAGTEPDIVATGSGGDSDPNVSFTVSECVG